MAVGVPQWFPPVFPGVPSFPCLSLFLFMCVCVCVCGCGPPGPLLSPSNTPALQSSHSPHLSFPAHSLTCFHFPQSATHTYIQTQILCPLPDHRCCFGLSVLPWTRFVSLDLPAMFFVPLAFMLLFLGLDPVPACLLACLLVYLPGSQPLKHILNSICSASVCIWVLSCPWSEPLQHDLAIHGPRRGIFWPSTA